MKALYWIRVSLLSIEALLLLLASLAWAQFRDQLEAIGREIAPNEELLKYLILLPLGLAAWVSNEVRQLLHEDRETTRLLTAWSSYWRLKVHVWVALLYAVLFSILSIVPWFFKSGISSPGGFLLFTLSLAGQIAVAASVYIARLQVKEALANTSQL